MVAVLRSKRAWRRIEHELSSGSQREMRKTEIPVISRGVGLHAANNTLLKVRRFRNVVEQKFVGAIYIFDASPNIIAFSKTQRRFGKIAVPDQAFRGAISSP